MKLDNICTNCMQGQLLPSGQCNCCGQVNRGGGRLPNALPDRYLLHGQYYIGRVIGAGGFGITYLAWDTRNSCRVAVKELFPKDIVSRMYGQTRVVTSQGKEEDFSHLEKRFLDEARLLIRLKNHRQILQVYHLFPDNQTAYFVMEYLSGVNLKEWLKRNGKMPWNQLSVYIRQIMDSLEILHGANQIHRDISPDNILLTGPATAKLIDYGLARSYVSNNGMTTYLKEHFAPYEQYRTHGQHGTWSDVYSLAATMYYALSGVVPPSALERQFQDTTKHLGQLCPDLPPQVADAVMKGMAVNVGQRYQTIREFSAAIYGARTDRKTAPKKVWELCCVRGIMKGKQWSLAAGRMCDIGRMEKCHIRYPMNSPGISRLHLSVMVDGNGRAHIRDNGSTYGSYLNAEKLKPGVWYAVGSGAYFTIAGEQFLIRLK